jgi:hypothetical protein
LRGADKPRIERGSERKCVPEKGRERKTEEERGRDREREAEGVRESEVEREGEGERGKEKERAAARRDQRERGGAVLGPCECLGGYKGTSLTRNYLPLGPYTMPMSRALWWSSEESSFS